MSVGLDPHMPHLLALLVRAPDDVAQKIALLNEQAPNRHNRACMACGAAPGDPCRDVVERIEQDAPDSQAKMGRARRRRIYVDRIVPHESRVRIATDDGPLFGGTS